MKKCIYCFLLILAACGGGGSSPAAGDPPAPSSSAHAHGMAKYWALLLLGTCFASPVYAAASGNASVDFVTGNLWLLVARPLFRLTLSAKIAAVALGLYGLLYHILLAGVLTLNVVQADIGAYAESIRALLLVPIISMAVYFRMQPKEISNE